MTRQLIITENMTLDGVIEADDWFDVIGAGDTGDLDEVMGRHQEAATTFLTGRVTFEEMRGYWPHQTDDTTGVTEYLDRVDKAVVSTTMTDPEWDGSRILDGDLAEDVAALKEEDGGDIVVTGSIELVNGLHRTGLVDRYRLFTYPVVRGTGRRLFEEPDDLPALALDEVERFRSGVVLLEYATTA